MPQVKNELCSMEIGKLTSLYEKEFEKLKVMLIQEDDWSEVRIQQKVVSKLSGAIHQKLFPNTLNPAEHNNRK